LAIVEVINSRYALNGLNSILDYTVFYFLSKDFINGANVLGEASWKVRASLAPFP